MSSAAVVTEGLSKVYGTVSAVSDLGLCVEAGQVFGFLGPNGAGKTTTIRLLLALQRPSAGSARVLGLDVQRDGVEVHRRVGYLPGDLALFPRLTGQEHLDWFSRARGIGHDAAFLRELVDRFEPVLDRPTRELSTGNRQKIGLAMAFMHRPELVVLDEPTAGLDPLMQDEFERLLRDVVADGLSVFLSSHELDEIQRVADSVGIIRAGRLVATDSVEHLRASAPRHVEVTFDRPVERGVFERLPGVEVAATDGSGIVLRVSGPIRPLLGLLAEQDPVDVVIRPPDLDELFRGYYRADPGGLRDVR